MITIILFVFSAFYLISGIHILSRSWNSLRNRMLFSLCTNLTCWSFGYAFMTIAPNQETANLWRLVAAFGWCFSYSTWLDFAILIRSENKKWMANIKRLFLYLPSIFFFLVEFKYEPNEVMMRVNNIWRDTYPSNYIESLFIIYYVTYVITGIVIIFKWGKKSVSQQEKKQANILVISTSISFFIAAITDSILPLFGWEIFPWGIIILSIALLGIWHAIAKYKMLTISTKNANEYILSTMKDPVILFGNDYFVKEANNATLTITGYGKNEIKRIPIRKIFTELESYQTTITEFFRDGGVKNIEVSLRTKNNNIIPCLLSGSFLHNDSDEILGIVLVLHDITDRKNAENILKKAHQELENKVDKRTIELEESNAMLEEEISERKKAEEHLKSSEEKFRALMKQSADGIFVFDPETYKIVESNEEVCKILEYTEDELVGVTIERLLHIQKDGLSTRIDEINAKNYMLIKENVVFMRKDGTTRNLEISSTRVGYSNKQFIMVTLRDITEKLSLEQRKQQMGRMESLGTLAGGIAHDFNNILAGMIGYTQLSLEDAAAGGALQENLQEVLKLGERAKKLISQILTFSRRSVIDPQIVDIKFIIEDIVKMLKATASIDIEIKCNFQCDAAFVFADQVEMHQLLMNLCVNAEAAMKTRGGILEVELMEAFVEEEEKVGYQIGKTGKYVKIKVSDTGCGIEKAIMERIFEPFFTTRVDQGGTGLGLSVVHGIVSRYGGYITVESEPNRGSIFTVLLPAVKEHLSAESRYDEVVNNSAARILFVDDEESIVNTIQKILQREGYDVTGVLGGKNALTIFKQNKDLFDIVITDQSMPDMTGDFLVKELRNIRLDIPVILCSGYNYERSNSQEIAEFLLKPVSKLEYVNAIEKVMKNKKTNIILD